MTKDEHLARVAARQHALITLDDARRLGLSADDIEYRCASGRLVRLRRGVLVVAGSPRSWEQHALATCLAAGLPVVASHLTAAYLHGFRSFEQPEELEITEPWPVRTRLVGVRAHRVNTLDDRDTTRIRSIPVTSVARTVIDIASVVTPERLRSVVNDLLRRRMLTVPALRGCSDRVDDSRLRRRRKLIHAVIAEREKGFHPGDSDPEVWMVQTLTAAGLPKPVQQHRVTVDGFVYRLDAAYPEFMVGMEYEGWAGHGQPGDIPHDRLRLNRITAAGWDIRFATTMTSERELVDDVRKALRRAGASL